MTVGVWDMLNSIELRPPKFNHNYDDYLIGRYLMSTRNYNRSREILAYMSKKENIGVVMSATDVMSGLRIPEAERNATVSSLSHMAHNTHVIESPARGAYVYTGRPHVPTAKDTKKVPTMFEYVGTLKSGDQLARDEDGNLFRFEQI